MNRKTVDNMIDLKTYEPKGRDQQRYMDIFHDFRQIEQGGHERH